MPVPFRFVSAAIALTGFVSGASAQTALTPAEWDQMVVATLAENFPFCSTGPGMELEGVGMRVVMQVILSTPDAPDVPVLIPEGAAAVQRQVAAGVVIADAEGVRLAQCPADETQLTLQFRHQANELLLLETADRASLLADIFNVYGCEVAAGQEQPFFIFAMNHVASRFDLPPPLASGHVAGTADFFEAVDIFLAGTQRRMIESGQLIRDDSGGIRLAECVADQ